MASALVFGSGALSVYSYAKGCRFESCGHRLIFAKLLDFHVFLREWSSDMSVWSFLSIDNCSGGRLIDTKLSSPIAPMVSGDPRFLKDRSARIQFYRSNSKITEKLHRLWSVRVRPQSFLALWEHSSALCSLAFDFLTFWLFDTLSNILLSHSQRGRENLRLLAPRSIDNSTGTVYTCI